MEKYSEETGEPLHKATTDMFGVQTFERNVSNFKKLGYTLKVLHDPREFLKNQAEQAAARAEQEEQNKIEQALQKQREEFEKTRQADIEQAVNKALAERDKQAEQSEKPKKQDK
jgi:flagellar biosynthesis/type III secretory pathway protein FliH